MSTWTERDERVFNEMQVRRTQVLAERHERLLGTLVDSGVPDAATQKIAEHLVSNAGPICDALAAFRTDLPGVAE